MKKIIFISATCALLILLVGAVFGGTVSLDPTFNGTGYRIHSINSEGSIGESVGIQPDGKIVLGGWTITSGNLGSFAAMRLNTNGTLDTSFDSDGYAITTVANFNRGDTLLTQPDGKILLGGERYFGDSNDDFTILRYNTNGTLDNTFDGNGVAAPVVSGFSDEHCYDMALQPDGKIVMVGTTAADDNAQTNLAIMRLNTNGSLDTTFNGTGILIVTFQNVNESANAVVIQNDGKIVIGGFLNNTFKNDFLLMRFNPNGFPDTTFGSSGITITSVSSANNSINTMALQSDGKILAGGSGYIARYTADGILDNTFGNNGTRSAPHNVSKILVRGSDKFLVSGTLGGNVAVSRYNANGAIDTSFNNTGTATANVPNNSCAGRSLAVQNDNKIVIGGDCTISNNTRFAVFRLQEATAKGYLDFDGDSKTDIGIFRPSAGEWWLNRSSTGVTVAAQFGQSTDKPVPADFTGDGKSDIAFWRPSTGEWFILRSEDGSFLSFPFGTSGDVPVAGDFDGDGKADAGVFRPSTNEWFISKSSGGTIITTFGVAGDVPVTADYDGDGKTDIAIYRPSAGQWWIQRSSNLSVVAAAFGNSTDKPVQGDYSGDGKADIAFYRPSTGEWFILRSEDGSFYSVPFGASGDLPAPGDYDGDGKFDTAVFRPSSVTWFINRTTAGLLITSFGAGGDQPLPNVFVP